MGPDSGFFPNDKKCWIIVKPEKKEGVKEAFKEMDINITVDYNTRNEHLLSTLRKKEKEIEELEEKCLSFENRALFLEQENDSLRLALKIIVQEKNKCDSRPQKADDRWSLMENTHAANRTKIKRNQQTIPNDNTDTRNRFDLLGNEVQSSFINVSPTPNSEPNKDGRNRIPSARRSQTSNSRSRTDKADSVRNGPLNQSAKRKEVFIVGDSILKNLQGRKISRSAKVKVSSFPGCTTMDMRDHEETLMRLGCMLVLTAFDQVRRCVIVLRRSLT